VNQEVKKLHLEKQKWFEGQCELVMRDAVHRDQEDKAVGDWQCFSCLTWWSAWEKHGIQEILWPGRKTPAKWKECDIDKDCKRFSCYMCMNVTQWKQHNAICRAAKLRKSPPKKSSKKRKGATQKPNQKPKSRKKKQRRKK
jgi:hypothetical protein